MSNTEAHCPGCENACPVNALSCAKGRALHGISEAGETESLVQKLIRCGATAEIIADEMDSYGLEEDTVINGLSSEKMNQLSEILDDLSALWKRNFGK